MGNEIGNYSKGYNLWIKYRVAVKQVKQARSKSPITNAKAIQKNGSVEKNKNHKIHSQTQLIKYNSAKKLHTNKEQIKRKMPSIVTGSKIDLPLSEQIIKGNLNTASLTDNSPLLKNKSPIKNKTTSAKDFGSGIEVILVKNGNRNGSRQKTVRFPSKIDMVETLKGQAKQTRQRIDILANSQQRQYIWMLSEIQSQKNSGISDRNKVLFLIKQCLDYERLIVDLRTKRKTIVNIINQLNQQRINENMQVKITQINNYVELVQQQFIKIDWRAIINETSVNMQRYVEIINFASSDKYVLRKLAEIQNKQSFGSNQKLQTK